MFANPDLLICRLLFVGLIVESFETVALRQTFSIHGMFSTANLAILTGGTRWQVRVGATSGAASAVVAASIAQACLASVVIVVGTHRIAGLCATLLCLGTNGYLRSRRQIGGSGAEQLTFMALVTFALVILAGGSETARRIGDGFLAAQVLLAYLASGVSKAASPIWRDGRAMAGILSTEGYGTPRLAGMLAANPGLDKVLCWAVILWETSFPLVLLAPGWGIALLLAIGVVFHLSCAIIMGLNRFVWAFCGCYPAVWATAMLLR